MKDAGKKDRNVSNNDAVAYVPVVIKGTKNIMEKFGVSRKFICEAKKNGAPIYVGARGEYFCEVMQMMTWLRDRDESA